MNAIASYRAKAYTSYLSKFGIYPTIITHFWDDKKHKSIEKKEFTTHTEIRIPLTSSKQGNKLRRFERNKWLNKFGIIFSWLFGHLDTTAKNYDSYILFRNYLQNHLKEEKYDFLLGIFSPHHHLKLCYELHREHDIPYAIDFRDLWSNRILHSKYFPTPKEKIQDFLTIYYWKRWLSKAQFFTTVSSPILSKIKLISTVKGFVVTNGFEKELYERKEFNGNNKLKIIHTGSLYNQQKIELFFKGFKKFIKVVHSPRIEIIFIGGIRKNKSGVNDNTYSNISSLLEKYRLIKFISVTKRVLREYIIEEQINADILLFPTFPDLSGIYSGKIFEYLGARRPILSFPADNSVVDELIIQTNTGIICNTAEEIFTYLDDAYSQWKTTGMVKYFGIEREILKFSRQAQVKKMANLIIEEFSNIN